MGEEVKGKYVTCGTGDSQALVVGRGEVALKVYSLSSVYKNNLSHASTTYGRQIYI